MIYFCLLTYSCEMLLIHEFVADQCTIHVTCCQDENVPVVYLVYFDILCLQEILLFTKKLFVEVMNEMCTEITKEALDKVYQIK